MRVPSNNKDPQQEAWRKRVFEDAPSPWNELHKLQYGADRSLAHVVENEVLTAAPDDLPAIEKRLVAALTHKDATAAARDFICRLLRLAGSGACVDALAPLLADAELSHSARFALETIPDAKVDAALAAALPKTSGAVRQGLLGTIAARKDKFQLRMTNDELRIEARQAKEMRA